jgi:hypothetical protein
LHGIALSVVSEWCQNRPAFGPVWVGTGRIVKYGLPSSCRLCKRVNIEEQTKVSQDLDP